jgi:two-component system response regulator PrrA
LARILIVDDGDLRTLLGLSFLRCGQRTASPWDSIVVAGDGAVGLQCVATHAPDLLVTDVNLPVLDGLALLRRRRANGQRDLPVIVLTARADQRTAAIAAGADAFLVKPLPLRQLGETAERLMGERYALDMGS